MRLSQKQQKFAEMVGLLLHRVSIMPGYSVALGEAFRPPEMVAIYVERGTGSRTSLHGDKLAIDLPLWIDGVYQEETEAYRPLGEFWESIGGSWGGRFRSRPDGNHFSLEHEGRR